MYIPMRHNKNVELYGEKNSVKVTLGAKKYVELSGFYRICFIFIAASKKKYPLEEMMNELCSS